MLGDLARKLRRIVGDLGGRAARQYLEAGLTNYADWRFDHRFGTETAPVRTLDRLVIKSKNLGQGTYYQATQTRPFNRLMLDLKIDKEGTLVEFGSGMGRVLVLAAECGFKRIVGIEFAKDLCEIAVKNVEAYRRKSRSDATISVLHIDAAEYEIQASDTVFYFYNPFGDTLMRQVMENIRQSVLRTPRKVLIIYLNPICRKVIESEPWIEVVFERLYHRSRFVVYGNTGNVERQDALNQLGRIHT